MPANAVVRARIDENLKEEAAAILSGMGMSISDFVRIGLVRLVRERALPLNLREPNATTRQAMAELGEGGGQRYESAGAMFRSDARAARFQPVQARLKAREFSFNSLHLSGASSCADFPRRVQASKNYSKIL